ncbi:MAG TPA: methyltransferase domain-containing protein [Acidimicrobiia bacterium]|nr:methyltransferase domain-containing protein [Acidimicrobiia bacterium]
MARIRALEWWHTIDVAPGVVTPGSWELRPAARKMPWPADGDLRGLRCLDIGTMDGFWAFEMERRGAALVVASDLRARPTFGLAAELLRSRVSFVELNVYDLDPAVHGRFDVVFMGYVAELLHDPIGAFHAIRRVCSGHVIVLDQVSLPLSLFPRPLSRVAARPGYQEWFMFNRRGFVRALDEAGYEVEAGSGFMRDRPGPGVNRRDFPWSMRARHATGLQGVSMALRGRPRPAG